MLILPFVPADFPGRWVYDDDLSVQLLGVAYRSGCPVPVLAVVDGKECPGMVHHVPVAVKQAAIVVARRLSLPIGPSFGHSGVEIRYSAVHQGDGLAFQAVPKCDEARVLLLSFHGSL